jgi:hypothetical protein
LSLNTNLITLICAVYVVPYASNLWESTFEKVPQNVPLRKVQPNLNRGWAKHRSKKYKNFYIFLFPIFTA